MKIQQITNAKPQWIGNEYPSANPFNCDNTRLLLVANDHFQVYDGQGVFLRDLRVTASGEPRWSHTDPHTFYYISENRFAQGDSEGIANPLVLRTFNEYTPTTKYDHFGINGGGEGDLSEDGDHIALANGDKTDIWIYTISTNQKGPVFSVYGFDGLKVTPSGEAVVVSADDGMWVYAPKTDPRRIAPNNGHAAVGRDTDGEEILVWTNAKTNPIWPDGQTDSIIKIRLRDGETTTLLRLPPWKFAVNISLGPGFAFVSTNGQEDGSELSNKILKVALDGSGYEVVCPHNSRPTGVKNHDYNWQAKASLGRALPGKPIPFVFSSNSGDITTLDYCDTWMGELPVPKPDLPPQPIDPDKVDTLPDKVDSLTAENARLLQLLATLQAHDQQLAQDLTIAQSDALMARRDMRKAEAELEALHAAEPDVVALRLALAKAQSDLRDCNHIKDMALDSLNKLGKADDWGEPLTFTDFEHEWVFHAVSANRLIMRNRWKDGSETQVKFIPGNEYKFVAVSEDEFEEFAKTTNKK